MKQFRTLREAFAHRKLCPLCRKPISVGWESYTVSEDWRTGMFSKEIVTFKTGSFTIELDYNTDELIMLKAEGTRLEGTLMFRVICLCDACSRYSCVFQVHLETLERRIKGIYFNSESLSIESGSKLYDIKNSYASDKTEYTVFTNYNPKDNIKQNAPSLVLPLIPLNVDQPMKTLERIKKLVIFS